MARPANRFDRLDIAILSALNDNPRATSVELAKLVPLSRTAIARRISILRDMGAFTRSAEIISYQALGYEIEAVVDVATQSSGTNCAHKRLLEIPEVLSICSTTGQRQSVLRVISKDMNHFRVVAKQIQEIGDISTNIVISTTKSRTPLEDRLRLMRERQSDAD